MSNPFEDDFSIGTVFGEDETVYDLAKILNKSPAQIAIEFGTWFKNTFGGGGPKGPDEWIKHGDQWLEDSGYSRGGTTPAGQGSGLGQYLNDRNATTTTTTPTETTTTTTDDVDTARRRAVLENLGVNTTGMSAQEIEQTLNDIYDNQNIAPTETTTTTTDTDVFVDETPVDDPFKEDPVMPNVTVVDKFPMGDMGFSVGDLVQYGGIVYVLGSLGDWTKLPGQGESDLVSDTQPGGGLMEEITGTGSSGLETLAGAFGIEGILSDLIGSIASPNVSGGSSLFDKLLELYALSDVYKNSFKYKVPTSQMDAQSEIGKQWGLPTRESMKMKGLGPNYLQGQKYAMNLGQTMPAATHTVGMPYIEKGKHGGIMGIQQSYGDITPAFLEPGEFVFTKKATDNIGAKRLYKLMKQAEQMGME